MNTTEIYAKCLALGMTAAGAAGCTANIMAESAGNPRNVEDRSGINDDVYTQGVDSGSYRGFVDDRFGYGLVQLTLPSRKKAYLDFARSCGKSIGDADTQFQFIAREMKAGYPNVWNVLTHTADSYEAGYVMCRQYEIPADTERQAQLRGNQAMEIYRRCSGTTPAVDPEPSADLSGDTSTGCWPPRTICKGMSGADVTVLQAVLTARGYTVAVVNGIFDESTEKAVRKFQSAHGLAVDGIVGPKTWPKLLEMI